MTQIRLTLSGIIKNVRHFNAGTKPAVEFSMCVKNRGKPDEEPTFTWARGVVFEPPEWMKLEKGMEVTALNGQTTLRSYKDKDGADKVSLDAKFSSFDIQVHGNIGEQQRKAVPAPAPRRPAADVGGGQGSDEPPFLPRSEWE
jgi:hypothetical protein